MNSLVRIWLYTGVLMLLGQIFIGGVTRLTGSGLSITKWEIITGTFPPVSHEEWEYEFDLYKETPQYEIINQGMSLSQFKFIYFWEYFHRLWARLIGLVFIIPFLLFLRRGLLSRKLIRQLGGLVLLGALVASFGWIMVASGLMDRPWVNAYKLTLHLGLGISLFLYMWKVATGYDDRILKLDWGKISKSHFTILFVLVFIQVLFGGLMSGMKAGLFYPTWPDMNGAVVPSTLVNTENWTLKHLTDYDSYGFAPALVQFIHRTLAYALSIITILILYVNYSRSGGFGKKNLIVILVVLLLQVVLGILTLVACKGGIPVTLGVLHQLVAVLLLAAISFLVFNFKDNSLS